MTINKSMKAYFDKKKMCFINYYYYYLYIFYLYIYYSVLEEEVSPVIC